MYIYKSLKINQLLVGYSNLNRAFSNVVFGHGSFSSKLPIEVLKLDPRQNNGKTGFLLTDGYHRLVEAMLLEQKEIKCKIDLSGYSDYWAIPNELFEFQNSKFQGLEDFASEELLLEFEEELIASLLGLKKEQA